jgi:hypothetical protein
VKNNLQVKLIIAKEFEKCISAQERLNKIVQSNRNHQTAVPPSILRIRAPKLAIHYPHEQFLFAAVVITPETKMTNLNATPFG